MLYAKFSRSIAMPSSTATQLVSKAGETATKIRYEYLIGGDTDDLVTLIDKIKRQQMSTDFVIVPATYVRNGRTITSDRPGALLFYSSVYYTYAELHFAAMMTLKKGSRSGQTVEMYNLVPSDMQIRVKQLSDHNPKLFSILGADIQQAWALGTFEVPAGFKPAVVDLSTGLLQGVSPKQQEDAPMDNTTDAGNETDGDTTPEDFDGCPF
mgnify:CR=1 FL=1